MATDNEESPFLDQPSRNQEEFSDVYSTNTEQQKQQKKVQKRWSCQVKKSRAVVLLSIVGMIIFGVASSVLRKKMMNAFGTKYIFFRQELTNLLYNLYVTAIVIYKLLFTDHINREMLGFPIWKFAMLGFFDGFTDFLQSVGGVNTPGEFQVLLGQLVILFTMLFAFFLLSQRYNVLQLVGAVAILGGIVIVIVPTFGKTKYVLWYSLLIYSLSNIPAALSATLKEKYFKKAIDIFWLTTVVSWTQFVLTWVFFPLLSLPLFGGVPLSQLPEIFSDGARCFVGQPVPIYDDISSGHHHHIIVGNCSSTTPLVTMGYSVSGFFAGIFSLFVISQGGAVLYVVASAVALPLSNMAFTIHALMGDDTEPLTAWNVGGLVVVFLGFLIYSYFGIKHPPTTISKVIFLDSKTE